MLSLELELDRHLNMARDSALLDAAERGSTGARVYTWDQPCVSLGRFQRVESAMALMGAGLPWVVRPTGGKAVLHGDDVTVAIGIPLSNLHLGSRDVKAAYRAVAAPIVASLRYSGISASLAEGTQWSGHGRRTADCFAFSSPNDIIDKETGAKICGCALRLTENAVLVQASIRVESLHPATFAEALKSCLTSIAR